MPGRRWGMRHSGGFNRMGVCPRRIMRFVEPSLLLLLREDANHGYNLLEGIKRFGYTEGSLDPSIVYRALHDMESENLVVSQWDTTESGPPRRVYRITKAGEDYLSQWVEDLRRMRDELERFLTIYDERS